MSYQPRRMYLIAEFCAHNIYGGWHLYLRDSMGRQQRNADGGWGWLSRSLQERYAREFLATLGITLTGDGSCDHDGYAEVARRFPIPRQRIGGKPRGCIPVDVIDQYGTMRAVVAFDGERLCKPGDIAKVRREIAKQIGGVA